MAYFLSKTGVSWQLREAPSHRRIEAGPENHTSELRGIFEDPAQRAKLVEIRPLFSEVGWTDALRLR